MSLDEINAIYKAKYESDKATWEQTRLICYYSVIAMNGNKTFQKASDLFTFSWDKK